MESTPPNPYSSPAANLYGAADGTGPNVVSPSTIAVLAGTRPWVIFMAVIMWIAVAMMLLGGSVMILAMIIGAASAPIGKMELGIMIGTAAFYVVVAILLIYPTLKMSKFSSKISRLVSSRSVEDLNAALHEQRRYWKFMGILVILYICLIVVGFIALAVAGQSMVQMLQEAGSLPVKP